MGLDNGIKMRRKDNQEIDFGGLEFEKWDDWYDIFYLRKFWAVRDEIVGKMNKKYGDAYEWTIDSEDLKNIYEIVRKWIWKVAKYGEAASTIWTREEEMVVLSRELEKINDIICLIEEDGEDEYEMRFYDSY